MPATYTQYILLDEDGEQAMSCHQDDSEDPIVGGTIGDLLSVAAEWEDMAVDDYVKSDEFKRMTIHKEVVTRKPLNKADQKELAAAIANPWGNDDEDDDEADHECGWE